MSPPCPCAAMRGGTVVVHSVRSFAAGGGRPTFRRCALDAGLHLAICTLPPGSQSSPSGARDLARRSRPQDRSKSPDQLAARPSQAQRQRQRRVSDRVRRSESGPTVALTAGRARRRQQQCFLAARLLSRATQSFSFVNTLLELELKQAWVLQVSSLEVTLLIRRESVWPRLNVRRDALKAPPNSYQIEPNRS